MTPRKTTTINRTWLIKLTIFTAVLLCVGVVGLRDALWVYPAIGRRAASFALKNYLEAARDANRLTPGGVKIENPAAALSELGARQRAQQRASGSAAPSQPLTALEESRLEFLRSLSRAWMLSSDAVGVGEVEKTKTGVDGSPVYSGVGGVIDARKQMMTQFFNPRTGEATYAAPDGSRTTVQPDSLQKDLTAEWAAKNQPPPLAAYDVPSQWLFVIAGFGGALYLIFLIVRVIGKRFSYEPEDKRLILPGGESFVPAEVKEFDKRKWHKFYVTVNLRDGRDFRLDLLRYVPLEDWVLEMERTAFPNQGADEETKDETITITKPEDDGPRAQPVTPKPT